MSEAEDYAAFRRWVKAGKPRDETGRPVDVPPETGDQAPTTEALPSYPDMLDLLTRSAERSYARLQDPDGGRRGD